MARKHELLSAIERSELGPLFHALEQEEQWLDRFEFKPLLSYHYLTSVYSLDDGHFVIDREKLSASLLSHYRKSAHSLRAPGKVAPQVQEQFERVAHFLDDAWKKKKASLQRHQGHDKEIDFYSAWLAQLKSSVSKQKQVAKHFPGIYCLFRPSIAHPDRVVRGVFVFYRDSNNVLRTYELNRLKGSDGSESNGVKVLGINEEHQGFAIRKSSTLLVQSFELKSGEQQVSVFSVMNDDDKQYTHLLDGLYLGVVSSAGVTCRPMVLVRQADFDEVIVDLPHLMESLSKDEHPFGRLKEQADLVSYADVPAIVRARLTAKAMSPEIVSPKINLAD